MRYGTPKKILAGILLSFPLAYSGCELECNSEEPALEKVGENVEEAVDEAGDAVEDAGDAVQDATDQ